MTIRDTVAYITDQLQGIYEPGEAAALADWVLEHVTGIKKSERNPAKQISFSSEQVETIDSITKRLLTHEPIQYILNESWFCGLKFYVDSNVLIPRPETEELVEWIISNCRFPVDELKILDIGTGSGCIPVTLKRRIRKAEVWSCDVSPEALKVARKNAVLLGAEVNFVELDILNPGNWKSLPSFDIIVSNPPYVPVQDKKQMRPNVLDYEPAVALFVPAEDPLLFYRVIAELGKSHLNGSGSIYAEIHEGMGDAVLQLFRSGGYPVELKKDMQQKDRLIRTRSLE